MSPRRECIFMIRMWHSGERIGDGDWRGSIHDVTTGRRRYISALVDVSEFLMEALLAEAAAAEPPSESSH